MLGVTLRGPWGEATPELLIDSGSEYTLVDESFAREVGLAGALDRERWESIKMGGQPLRAYIGEVEIEVPFFQPYVATIGWVPEWPFEAAHAGVLGQRGFFDRFYVVIDRANLRAGIVDLEAGDAEFEPPLTPPEVDPEPVRLPFKDAPTKHRAMEQYLEPGSDSV